MGKMGSVLMVITTKGRKTGKSYSTPIGFQRDGDTVVAFNVGGSSNWYKNIAHNPVATLEIQQKTYQMRGQYVTDTDEIRRILELYQREQPSMLSRFFGIAADASGDALMKAAERIKFVRFYPM